MGFLTFFEQLSSQWWTIAIATLIIFVVYFRGIAPFRALKRTFGDRVQGPMPLPFIGNMRDLIRHKRLFHLQIDEYYKKYGEVFGMYLFGSLGTLVTADLDMVKQVYVKDFPSFHDRPVSSVD